ncbi:hypothetical protein NUW58_g1321 [Xylaria curta]|uniref:Uncharacterized protein n=1 Tax=Xylaria curta TaxID=42375 RepID=A0ACC1PMI4_9PEZI|nr:hypothetical protein NUW58_g1321 [Xylaria curta]
MWSTAATAGSHDPSSSHHNGLTSMASPSGHEGHGSSEKQKKKSSKKDKKKDKKKRQDEALLGIGAQFTSGSFTSSEGCREPLRKSKLPPSPADSNSHDGSGGDVDGHKNEGSASDIALDRATFDEIVTIVSDCSRSVAPRENLTFYLQRGQRSYSELLDVLEDSGVRDYFEGLRSRWNAYSGRLTLILMTDPLRECFKVKLDVAIQNGLDQLTNEYPTIAHMVKDIHPSGHIHVSTEDAKVKRSPDGQFCYNGFVYPPLVYEIAHSESEKDLHEAFREYLGQWPNALGAVVGFKFDYNHKRSPDFAYTASVCLWTATVTDDTLDCRVAQKAVFRLRGQAQAGSLALPFELFIPPHQRHTIPDDAANASVSVDFQSLNKWAALAEYRQGFKGAKAPEEVRAVKRTRFTAEDGSVTITEGPPVPKRRRRSLASGVGMRTRSRALGREAMD